MPMWNEAIGTTVCRAVIPVLILIVTGGCGVIGNEIEQEAPQQMTREIDVKRALIASDAVGAAPIRVSVSEDGTVTLDGFVDSEAERVEALRVAREALGGEQPIDALEVRN